MVEYGYVDKGNLGSTNNHLPCQKLSGNGWNFFELFVDENGDVDAHINGLKHGNFHSHFTPRGFGGVLVANGYNNVAEFRNFDISPILPYQACPPKTGNVRISRLRINIKNYFLNIYTLI